MNDPFDDRIADALHSEPSVSPDPAAAHAEFLVRRRRRQQRVITGAAVAAVVALTAGALALTNHHKGKTVPVAANGRTAQPQLVVTNADNGKSYSLHRGDTLEVRLSGGTYHWSPPMSSNEAVLRRTAVATGTTDGGAWASFLAVADGQADVTSTGDPPCRQSTPPCMAPSQLFRVSLRVTN